MNPEYTPQDFLVSKEFVYTADGYRHVTYESITDNHNKFWVAKGALKRCKAYAKETGFKRVIIVRRTIKTKDIIYDIKK